MAEYPCTGVRKTATWFVLLCRFSTDRSWWNIPLAIIPGVLKERPYACNEFISFGETYICFSFTFMSPTVTSGDVTMSYGCDSCLLCISSGDGVENSSFGLLKQDHTLATMYRVRPFKSTISVLNYVYRRYTHAKYRQFLATEAGVLRSVFITSIAPASKDECLFPR